MDRPIDVIIAPHYRGQASMDGHHSVGICRGTSTTPGRPGCWLIDWAASSRLQNAFKYCIKVCKTGSANKEYINSATVQSRVTKFYTDIHAHRSSLQPQLIWRHQLLPVSSYCQKLPGETAVSHGFGSYFSDAAFCLAQTILLFVI